MTVTLYKLCLSVDGENEINEHYEKKKKKKTEVCQTTCTWRKIGLKKKLLTCNLLEDQKTCLELLHLVC